MMRSLFARLALGLALLLALGYGVFLWQGGTNGLVRRALPEWPDLPAPQTSLVEDQSGLIYFPSETPFDFDVLLAGETVTPSTTGMGTLFLPEGASAQNPVPGMILLHGSGGVSPGREMEYGQLLAENGYAAFVLDYYAPRGSTLETPYMVRVLSVTEFDAIADAYSALRLLSTHPAIDGKRIGVVGFSYGGMAARFALDERIKERFVGEGTGFAAHVDYYGPCFQNLGTLETTGAPLLTLRGDQDASNDLTACTKREAELRAAGSEVKAYVLPGAAHAWEVDKPRMLHEEAPYVAGCEMVYNANGHSFVDGQAIVDTPLESSREERITIRIGSGKIMKMCVKSGYIIGMDPAVKVQSDQILLAFLARTLR
jgi:dienelactone hydrolase